MRLFQSWRDFLAFPHQIIKQLVAKQIKRTKHRSLSQDWIGGEPFLLSFEQLLLAFAWVLPFQLFDQAQCGRSCFLVHRCFPFAMMFTGLKHGTKSPRRAMEVPPDQRT
jgi:hypothetical protein